MLGVSNISFESNPKYLDLNITMDRGRNNGYLMIGRAIQDIPNLYSHIIFTVLSTRNASSLILLNATINFCEFMADTTKNLFLKSFYDLQADEAKFPKRCPIKKVL